MQILGGPTTTQAAPAQNSNITSSRSHSPLTRILTKRLFDSYTGSILSNQEIVVDDDSGLILSVKHYDADSELSSIPYAYAYGDDELNEWSGDLMNAKLVDLGDMQLVLPGFVDTHVHRKQAVLSAFPSLHPVSAP